MKRSEIIHDLREALAANADARRALETSDAKIAALIDQLAAPPAEQVAPQERPASDFVVQPDDGRDDYTPPSLRGTVQFDGDPEAVSMAALITPKQLGMIRALARECGVDYELECQEQFNGVKVEALNKRAASAFIDYLKVIQEQGADFRRAS